MADDENELHLLTVRMPKADFEAALRVARANDKTISQLVRGYLRSYVARNQKKGEQS